MSAKRSCGSCGASCRQVCLCFGERTQKIAPRFGELVRFFDLDVETRRDDELRDALTVFHGLRLGAVVLQKHPQLSAVIGVDHADAVGGGELALCGDAAAGKHQSDVPLRDLHGNAGGEEALALRGNGRALLPVRQQGVKINTRGERGAARGQYGIFTELFARNFHMVFFL